MTTSVTIINHGPYKVSVAPVDNAGAPVENQRQVVPSMGISKPILLYDNQNVHVREGE